MFPRQTPIAWTEASWKAIINFYYYYSFGSCYILKQHPDLLLPCYPCCLRRSWPSEMKSSFRSCFFKRWKAFTYIFLRFFYALNRWKWCFCFISSEIFLCFDSSHGWKIIKLWSQKQNAPFSRKSYPAGSNRILHISAEITIVRTHIKMPVPAQIEWRSSSFHHSFLHSSALSIAQFYGMGRFRRRDYGLHFCERKTPASKNFSLVNMQQHL